MASSSTAIINSEGKCPHHPVIQLKRKHRRTGEWKVILTECPLCASGLPPADAAVVGNDGNTTPGAAQAKLTTTTIINDGNSERSGGERVLNNSLDLPLTDDDDDDDDSSYISTRSSRSSISYTLRPARHQMLDQRWLVVRILILVS